jgi:hypothetical protein
MYISSHGPCIGLLLLQVALILVSFARALRKVEAGKLLTNQLTKKSVIDRKYELKLFLNIVTARIGTFIWE